MYSLTVCLDSMSPYTLPYFFFILFCSPSSVTFCISGISNTSGLLDKNQTHKPITYTSAVRKPDVEEKKERERERKLQMIVVCSTVPRCRWSKQLDSARWQTGLLSGFHLDLNNMGGRRGGGGGYCNMATFSWCLNTESSPGMIVMSRMLMLLRCVVCVCVCVTEGGKDNVPAAKVQFLL